MFFLIYSQFPIPMIPGSPMFPSQPLTPRHFNQVCYTWNHYSFKPLCARVKNWCFTPADGQLHVSSKSSLSLHSSVRQSQIGATSLWCQLAESVPVLQSPVEPGSSHQVDVDLKPHVWFVQRIYPVEVGGNFAVFFCFIPLVLLKSNYYKIYSENVVFGIFNLFFWYFSNVWHVQRK